MHCAPTSLSDSRPASPGMVEDRDEHDEDIDEVCTPGENDLPMILGATSTCKEASLPPSPVVGSSFA